MFKKRLVLIGLFLTVSSIVCGCKKNDDAAILFNTQPINKATILNNSKTFGCGKRIYYIALVEKPLTSDLIRVQILKKDEKTTLAGVKIYYAEDFRLFKDQIYYYTDYVVIYEPGYYIMRVFSKDNTEEPLATSDFYVKN